MDPSARADGEFRQWMHRLRNELNGVAMATAAAAALLDAGAPPEQVARNLGRAQDACRRCRDLLQDVPEPGP
ncbi:hypothetical protein [Vulcaniibacterium tengchongense]|uniref:Histidine kinase n=1 Tax=Vulcaniibacterium tengchongense TaxID=1273429 RepID=A0A3N4VIJ7_9GAMM|nr:hypothetical protein [Vulcaniibacterium tengchongense]RPE76917.1 hypothetical protein EDC50_2169 [Vulcaniibacterium tengchongense]